MIKYINIIPKTRILLDEDSKSRSHLKIDKLNYVKKISILGGKRKVRLKNCKLKNRWLETNIK